MRVNCFQNGKNWSLRKWVYQIRHPLSAISPRSELVNAIPSRHRTPDHGQWRFTFPIWLSETPSGRHDLFFAGHLSPWMKIFRSPSGSSEQNPGNEIKSRRNNYTASLVTLKKLLGNLKTAARILTPENSSKPKFNSEISWWPTTCQSLLQSNSRWLCSLQSVLIFSP